MSASEAEAGLPSAGEQVLVVEDDPELRNVIACMLTKLGYPFPRNPKEWGRGEATTQFQVDRAAA